MCVCVYNLLIIYTHSVSSQSSATWCIIAEHAHKYDYHLIAGNGCVECECNLEYAVDNACHDSGQCVCNYGIGGTVCDQCLDGYVKHYSIYCTFKATPVTI